MMWHFAKATNTAAADPPTVVERVSMKAKNSGKRAEMPSTRYRPRHPDWEGPWHEVLRAGVRV